MQLHNITCFNSHEALSHFRHYEQVAWDINGLLLLPAPSCFVTAEDQLACPELLIWLPGVAARKLAELAQEFPCTMTVTSADYLETNTYLCWETPSLEVRVDTWRINSTPVGTGKQAGFGVTFLNEHEAWHASHPMSDEDVEDILCELQVASMRSGPNYNPYREWSESFLEEHKHLQDETDRVVVPICLHRQR